MNNRTLAKTKNQNVTTFSPVFSKKLAKPTFTLQSANEAREISNLEFGHNFGDVQVENPAFKKSCPLALSGPSHCPFGGACHTCPPRVQTKLKIGQPGDKYEQEADRVAEQVMRMPAPHPRTSEQAFGTAQSTHLHRQCVECEDEEAQIQRKPLVSKITPLVQRQTDDEEELIPEEEEEEEEVVQAKQAPGQSPEMTHGLAAQIHSLRGRGQPLPKSVRVFFEPRFGYDFSQVSIHANPQAAQTARDLRARAFTKGWDIVFDAGQYNPETSEGRRLLAHELTHTLQQNSASTPSFVGPRLCSALMTSNKTLLNKNPVAPVQPIARAHAAVQPVAEPATLQTDDEEEEELQAKERSGRTPEVTPQMKSRVNDLYVRGRQPLPESNVIQRAVISNCFRDEDYDEHSAVEDAVKRATENLTKAVNKLSKRPLSKGTKAALFLAFRSSSKKTAKKVKAAYEEILRELPTDGFRCLHNNEDIYEKDCIGVVAKATYVTQYTGIGDVSICIPAFMDQNERYRANIIVHESSHRHQQTSDNGYFNANDMRESRETAGLPPRNRLDNADSYAAFAHYISARSQRIKSKRRARRYRGRRLAIRQSMSGPINLNGPDPKVPEFEVTGIPPHSGFAYRWIIDVNRDRWQMWSDAGSVFHFGPSSKVYIGTRSRRGMAKKGYTSGVVLCRVRLWRRASAKGRKGTVLLKLPVTFKS